MTIIFIMLLDRAQVIIMWKLKTLDSKLLKHSQTSDIQYNTDSVSIVPISYTCTAQAELI